LPEDRKPTSLTVQVILKCEDAEDETAESEHVLILIGGTHC
jgi:hypothetical protein